MRPCLIYAIIDCKTNEVRYVGKTVNPQSRYSKHKSDKAKTHLGNWLRKIDYNVEFIELEWVLESDWIEAEKFWISYVKYLGARLTNILDGGQGTSNPPQWMRIAISKRMKNNRFALGYKHTKSARQKISAANRGIKKAHGYRHTEDAKRRIGDASRGKINSKETIEKMKKAHKALSDKKSKDMLRVWEDRKENWVSKFDDAAIISAYKNGVPNKEILRLYGIGSTQTLYKILQRNGIYLGK